MSLRTIGLVFVASLVRLGVASGVATLPLALTGCGEAPPRSDEPTTAREKQRRDAEATGQVDAPAGKHGGWRYTGDRDDCFFILGRRCFKTEDAACKAARCGKHKCDVTGGGPATVACAK